MKKFLLGTVALVALGATVPALAADLGARPAYTKAPAAYAPIYNWTGFYIGGHIGGAFGSDNGFTGTTNLVLGYFIALPPLMAVTFFRKFYEKMGFIRYMVLANLLLFMMALPIKMVLRWSFNLKYLIAIPEYFLNF